LLIHNGSLLIMLTPSYMADSPPVVPVVVGGGIALPVPIQIGTVAVHPLGVNGLLAWMADIVAQGRRGRVSYANAHNVLLSAEDSTYRAALEATDMVFCDGFGVWGASRWLGTPLPERMTLPDWSEQLFALADAEGWTLFFLGAEAGVAERAAIHLKSRYPRLIINTHHGYFNPTNEENESLLAQINRANPTLLLVGMGPPRQDLWIHANHTRHAVPLTMAVGCLFDYMAGAKQRGPRWMTAAGAEWVWRLVREPQRLWRRYLLGNPRFIWHILTYRHPTRL
jgi:N-acetylglucosaminyldiphosphoundecaprenol N-acetyl-beta-D-mannosaminyltransferase